MPPLKLSQLPNLFSSLCYKCDHNRTSFFCRIRFWDHMDYRYTVDCELRYQFVIKKPFPKQKCISYHISPEYEKYLQTHYNSPQVHQIFL